MKKVTVNLPGKSYPVFIGDMVLPRIKKEITRSCRKTVIIDKNVERLHGGRIRSLFRDMKGDTEYFVLKNGENSKSLNELSRVYKFLLRCSADKESLLFSVGGGVTGDLSGFAASTFKRGIPLIHIPTTLLSAVDSSVGGKTAVNFDQRKNLAGTFYQPEYVFTDVTFLKTLPSAEIRSGIGELIKYSFLSDSNLFIYVLNNMEKIQNADPAILESTIYRSVGIKASIVMKDEKEESGLRKILNFGHTFGHAIESVLNYRIKHGEAVTAGIIAALFLSNKIGLLAENRLITYLKLPSRIKLPRALTGIDLRDVYEVMKDDKKSKGGKINFVLISEIGSIYIDISAGKDDIYKSLERMLEVI